MKQRKFLKVLKTQNNSYNLSFSSIPGRMPQFRQQGPRLMMQHVQGNRIISQTAVPPGAVPNQGPPGSTVPTALVQQLQTATPAPPPYPEPPPPYPGNNTQPSTSQQSGNQVGQVF